MKRLPQEDRFVIFEINGRYSTWNYLQTSAGVNLPYAAYRDSLGEKQHPLQPQEEGVRWIDSQNDLRAFREYRRLGEWKTWPWMRSYFAATATPSSRPTTPCRRWPGQRVRLQVSPGTRCAPPVDW